MKKIFYIAILLLLQIFAFGQINSNIKHIFYDLPLDKSRIDIKKSILLDKRFKSKYTDTSYFANFDATYIGLCSDNGSVKSKADSIEIGLTYGGGENKKGDYTKYTFLKIRYFYSSRDSVEKEYQNILNILRPILKDTAYTTIDTVYSASPLESQFKAFGTTFINRKLNYTIQVLNVSVTKNYYGLFIQYEREDENADLYSQADWKNMLRQQKFKLTENRTDIPLSILKQVSVHIDTITDIANPKESWNGSCTSSKRPRVKLNWAASYKDNWVISTTTGGYMVKTNYILISQDKEKIEIISNVGWTGYKFKKFKKKYLTDTLKE